MSRRGALFSLLVSVSAAIGAADAHAQASGQLPGGRNEPLRRLDADALPQTTGNLAGGDYGTEQTPNRPLAGGDYGAPAADAGPLAGGDYGLPSRPEGDLGTIGRSLLDDPLGAAPGGFRPVRRAAPTIAADDPYAPVGIKAGSFVLRPMAETAAGYSDNPNRRPNGGAGSSFGRLRGAIEGRSDWSRHELSFRASGQTRRYFETPNPTYEPQLNGAVTGRVDVTERTQINSELRGSIAAARPGDPETPTGVRGDNITRSAGATLGVAQRFNRFSLRLDGLVDRFTVDNARLRNGTTLDNSDRAYNSYEARLRGSYEISPKLAPFVEIAVDTRNYDKTFANNGVGEGGEIVADRRRLGSDGYALRGGAQFELTRLITGEAAIGYAQQTPNDKSLKTVEGMLIDGAVAWAPSALTTVRLAAKTGLQETTLANAGGVFTRSFDASVEHKLRRNLIVTAGANLQRSDYQGSSRVDDITTLTLEGEYRLNRSVALTASAQKLWLKSSLPGVDYTASIIEFGLRFRR